jgi:phosphatidylglycerophosphate synthase
MPARPTHDQPPRTDRIATLPNAISAMRLAIAVGLPFVEANWRLPLIIVGAVSDWLDGFVAHLTNTRSLSGQLLDPIADKALFLSALLTLAIHGEIEWWQAGMALLREWIVLLVICWTLALRDWSAFHRMSPSVLGKITTVLVFAWLLAVMLPWAEPLRMIFFTAASLFSGVTAVEYYVRFAKALRERHRLQTQKDTEAAGA